MNKLFDAFPRLREKYPDQIKQIETDQARATALLKSKEFYALEITQALLAICRKDVLTARKLLAADRTLDDEGRRELWAIIDARQWFIERASQNYEAELNAL